MFGYCGSIAFEEQYDSEETYRAACQRHEQRVRQEEAALPQPNPCLVVDRG